MNKIKNFIVKFKKWIIGFLVGGTALAGGLSGIPQDLYNNLNVKVYTNCDLQGARRTSIDDDLTNFKARNEDNSLRGLNANERASFKSCEIEKRGTEFAGIYDSVQYGTRVEIIGEVKAIEVNGQHGIELFARAWKGGQQLGFGKDGSVEIERFRIFNPPILVDDPNGTIIREWTDEITKELKQRKLREDPLEATRQVIAHNVKLVGKENTDIVIGKVGNTTSTFYPDANPESTSVDGFVYRNGTDLSWADIRDGVGTAVDDTSTVLIARITSGSTAWADIIRSIILFDTSSIGDTDTIDSGILSLYGDTPDDSYDFGLTAFIYTSTPASNTSLATSDYGNIGSTAQSNGIAFGSFAVGSYNNFTLNATGLGNISKTAVSKFGLRADKDANNTAPTHPASIKRDEVRAFGADQAGTANDPKLVVEHSTASAGVNKAYIIIEE